MMRTTKRPDKKTPRPQRPSQTAFGSVALVLLVFVGSGASCNSRLRSPFASVGPAAPQVLSSTSTVAQIVAAVNQNTARIQTYVTNNASIGIPGDLGLPLLRGNIAVQRPMRLRMRAATALTGPEVDLGSNDELYWLWTKRNEPPAVYFARHAEHPGSAAQQLLPIEPEWLLDALGLVTLDPNATYQGPLPRPDGTLELRTTDQTPLGPRQRVYVIDQTRGWVVEQHAYNASGQLLASAVGSDFRYDPVSQTSLPRKVELNVPAAGLALTINTGGVVVNSAITNPDSLFGLPAFEGYPQVDLGRSTALPTVGAAPPVASPPINSSPQIALREPNGSAGRPVGPLAPQQLTTPPTSRLPSGGVPLLR